MRREEIINQIKETLNQVAPWAKVILFGSEARGEAKLDSDIDLLIIIPDTLKDLYNKIKLNIIDELYLLELKNSVLISPMVLLQEMWESRKTPFTCNVEKDGILL